MSPNASDNAHDHGTDDLRARLASALPHLSDAQIEQVSPNFERVVFAPGSTILEQGDEADAFYILVQGRAEVLHQTQHGEVHVVDALGPGDHFGEIGLLKSETRTATVRATREGEVEALRLERDAFCSLMDDSRATETMVTQDLIRHMINLSSYQD